MKVEIQSSDEHRIVGNVTWRRESRELWITSTVPIAAPGEIFLSLLLLPAMALNENLEMNLPVSPKFLRNVPKIQQVVCSWWPKMRQVEITCPMDHSPQPTTADGKGLFFSGGVDSFHSLLRHRQELSHLILIHGFDYDHDDRERRQLVTDMANSVARKLEKELIQISTNARNIFDPIVDWANYHGGVLAAAGHAATAEVAECYVSSSSTREVADECPWGSHPDLDYLWSSKSVEFIHDAIEYSRTDKIREMSASPLARRHLRVCWELDHHELNCCTCEKCQRTMLGLHITGALDDFETFPAGLDPERLRWIRATKDNYLFLEDIVSELGNVDFDLRLKNAILEALNRPQLIHYLHWHWGNLIRFLKTGKRRKR